MTKLTSIPGNTQSLDGGAMFGNAPKALWSRWYTPDAENRIAMACRALLIETDDGRKILCDTGVGAFFPPQMRERYGVIEPGHVLLENLAAHGISHQEIDAVVLSHLHFDHTGGLLTPWEDGKSPSLLFPNALFVVGHDAWERALHPHPRDRASFIPELPDLLHESQRLRLVDDDVSELLGPGFRVHRSEGHTPGLLLLETDMPQGPVVFSADLIPGAAWIHLPITMGYDRFPERVIDEKTALLEGLLERHGRLFFTHDPHVAITGIAKDAKGRFHANHPLASIDGLTQ